MCMKNVNINLVFCDIISSNDNSSFSLGNIINKKFHIISDENNRQITQLSMAMFVSATQTKNQSKLDKINPDTTISFEHKYEIRVRLTETTSGAFMDLDDFIFEPKKFIDSDDFDIDAISYTRLILRNSVTLPENRVGEKFVIKILIRKQSDDRENDTGWIVQTIQPMSFDNGCSKCVD